MNLQAKRVLLTGASGAMGAALSAALLARGARVGLLARQRPALERIAADGLRGGGEAVAIAADVTLAEDRARAIRHMREAFGGVDVLINNAAAMDCTDFALQDPHSIERIMDLNALAPMQLSHAVLPGMLAHRAGHIVNIGSLLGAMGLAYFAAYSASKAALRGFSGALRRELAGTGVGVTYIAPRMLRGPAPTALYRTAGGSKMHLDAPAPAARRILAAAEAERAEAFLGFPESLLVRINDLAPRLLDRALRRHSRLLREHAQPEGGKSG